MRGTKEERAPGVWRLRVYTGADPITGNPRQVTRTFRGTKRQADTALSNFVTEVVRGKVPLTGSTRLGEYLDNWLGHITPTRSTTTVRGYRFKIKGISAKLGFDCTIPLGAEPGRYEVIRIPGVDSVSVDDYVDADAELPEL